EMSALVTRLFGAASPGLLPQAPEPPPVVRKEALGRMHSVRTTGPSRRLWMGAAAPGMRSGRFAAARSLSQLLDEGLLPAVNARRAAAGRPGALLDAGTNLDAFSAIGTFQVRAVLDSKVTWDDAAKALRDEVVARLKKPVWSGRDLARIRLEEK